MAAITLGTALAVGALTSAAGSGASAYMKSRAAGKAAKQQQQGATEASRYMQQGLGQLGQLYSPYINSGAGAMGTIGRLTTPGAGARYASPGPPSGMPMPPPPNQAVPRGAMQGPPRGGVQGPYLMAEGGDVVVDRPTMFIAGEAGPERATFSGAMPGGMGGGDDIRAAVMKRYAAKAPGGAPGAPSGDPRSAAQAAMATSRGGLRGFMGGGPAQGAGGWGGQFARMMPPPPQAPMQPQPPMPPQPPSPPQPQGGPMGQMAGDGGQRPSMVPQWAPMPPQGWGYY